MEAHTHTHTHHSAVRISFLPVQTAVLSAEIIDSQIGHWSPAHPHAPTCEEHASSQHLGQDAARRPHVDSLGVVVGGE